MIFLVDLTTIEWVWNGLIEDKSALVLVLACRRIGNMH